MKKIFLVLTLLCLSLSARADDAEIDGLFYKLHTANQTATVTHYSSLGDGDVEIPETVTYDGITYSVTSLGGSCFDGCSSLTSITIPNSVTSLGRSCFYGCSSLTSIYMLPTTPPSTGSSVFASTPLETVYVVSENAKTAYQAQEPWNNYAIVVMPTGIEELETDKTTPTIVGYYDLSGRPINGKQRGLVIERYFDGSSRKVMVK